MSGPDGRRPPLDVYIIAGEQSGDQLGASLIQALRAARGADISIRGIGGPAMAGQGLISLFPLSDIAVMGFLPVLARLPTLLARIRGAVADILARPPAALVIIDSPDFTHRVARGVRARLPNLPIIDYVSPTVWAWRPGRAKAMRFYVDHLLALLPFEPEAHRRLGGPDCVYVGHPLIERLKDLRPDAAEAAARQARAPTILILPGSRRSEIARLMDVFGATVARLRRDIGEADFVLPAVEHVESEIRARVASWPVKPRIVVGEVEKFAAFRRARAALAASGTVTLELALAAVPMVVGYRVSRVEERIVRALVTVEMASLPNIILGERAIPEFIQDDCTEENLMAALEPLVRGGPARDAQIEAFARIEGLMRLPDGETPSQRAATVVLRAAEG